MGEHGAQLLRRMTGIATLSRRRRPGAAGLPAALTDLQDHAGVASLDATRCAPAVRSNHRDRPARQFSDQGQPHRARGRHRPPSRALGDAHPTPAGSRSRSSRSTRARRSARGRRRGGDARQLHDELVAEGVRRAMGRALDEVSGGVTLERISTLARLGVDVVSVGALRIPRPRRSSRLGAPGADAPGRNELELMSRASSVGEPSGLRARPAADGGGGDRVHQRRRASAAARRRDARCDFVADHQTQDAAGAAVLGSPKPGDGLLVSVLLRPGSTRRGSATAARRSASRCAAVSELLSRARFSRAGEVAERRLVVGGRSPACWPRVGSARPAPWWWRASASASGRSGFLRARAGATSFARLGAAPGEKRCWPECWRVLELRLGLCTSGRRDRVGASPTGLGCGRRCAWTARTESRAVSTRGPPRHCNS